jgi:hypothetical protein
MGILKNVHLLNELQPLVKLGNVCIGRVARRVRRPMIVTPEQS